MEYVDLTIQVTADGMDKYHISVQCRGGEVTEDFVPPYTPGDLATSVWGIPEMPRDLRPPSIGCMESAEEMGDRIFRSLMPPAVRSRFDACLGEAEGNGHGLRIKIRLDPTDARVAWLGLIPWEMIYRTDRREFLGLSRLTPISRYLDTPHPTFQVPMPQPLRVLATMPRPRETPWLNLDREHLNLEESWEDAGIKVEVLDVPTAAGLLSRLCEPYHVFHFMGHGSFDEGRREGSLIFEREDGGPEAVRDGRLAFMLQGTRRPWLAVLNACETARTAAASTGTITGTAPALVRAGIPAVVSMLSPVSDHAAILFSKTLHARLVAGDPVDVAVAEGRRAVYDQGQSIEWAKPVVFMRTPDGRLFDVRTPEALPQPVREPVNVEADFKDIEYDELVVGGVIREGETTISAPAAGKASLRADRAKGSRFLFGSSVNLKEK